MFKEGISLVQKKEERTKENIGLKLFYLTGKIIFLRNAKNHSMILNVTLKMHHS